VSAFEIEAKSPVLNVISKSSRHFDCQVSVVIDVYSQGNPDFQSEDWSLWIAAAPTYSGACSATRIARPYSRSATNKRAWRCNRDRQSRGAEWQL
jgi:hypothetical protein